MRFAVVSTGFAPRSKQVCVGSVARQYPVEGVEVRHVYVDAAKQKPPLSCAENLYNTIRALSPTDVVVWLDGDDWFAHDNVIRLLSVFYTDPNLWLTYGSYRHADGRAGICAPYESDDYRRTPWRASHLKTFRAWLFQRIKPDDLKGPDGQWLSRAVDLAVMYPMLEMSGPERTRFIPDTLAIYNYVLSFEHNATPEELAEERRVAGWIRGKARYPRLETT